MDVNEAQVIDFEKICRLCLHEKQILTEIFESAAIENHLTIDQKIMACASVELCKGDGLPTRICVKCLANVNAAFDFRIQCENADKTLHEINDLLLASKTSNAGVEDIILGQVAAKEREKIPFEKHVVDGVSHVIFIKKQDIESDLEENASDLFYIIKDNKNEEKIEKKQVEKNHDRYRHEYFPSGESSDSLSLQEKYSDSNIEINSKISFVGECEDQTKIVIKQLEERNEIEVREFGSKEKEKHVGNLKKMPCPFCNKMLARIDEHIRLLHRNRVYKCTKHGCEAEFLTLKNLQSHQLNCFDITKAYKCSRCLKEFHRKSNYKAHVRRHANKKDFQCQLCDRAFVDSTGLRRHFLKHHEPEQEIFVSGCCGKRFKSKEGLKKHIRRSTCGIQIFQVVESNWRTNEVCTPKITQELSFERNC